MKPFLNSLLVFLLAALSVAADGPIVDLGYAKYQGSVDTSLNIASFLSLRYAAAPLGDLRFRAPQPPAIVSGVQQATTQPPACLQASDGVSPTNPLILDKRAAAATAPEDCLFLNVFTPTNVTGPLPVVVWIHGGGYIAGGASSFSGVPLIQESNYGVVAVIIQYRLGLFGFLPGAAVKKGGALNAGLLDQDFALRWVNKNIHLFGGDASRVTIWGESAGAGSVLQHVVAQNGRTQPQLFRGAITSSTFLPSQYAFNARIPELLYSEVVAAANCSSAADTLECLRTVDVNALETINQNLNQAAFFGTFLFVPVVDGEFITQRPTLSLQQGKVNGNALYAVTNTFEGRIFVSASNPLNASEYTRQLFPNVGPAQEGAAAALYNGQGTNLDQDIAIQGESIFICPTYFLLNAFKGRAHKGEYAVPPGDHGQDVAYYFGGTVTFNNTDFIKAFASSFLSFVMFQSPDVKFTQTITPANWPVFSRGNTEMLFNRTDAGQPLVKTVTTDSALLQRCQFWDGQGALTGQ